MLTKRYQFLKKCTHFKQVLRNQSNQTQNLASEKWDLFTAVCLERKPIITVELNQIEKEYNQLMSDIHFEKSLKSNFELRNEAEVKNLDILKKGGEIDDKEINLKQTAQDLKDSWSAELAEFKAADRITEADKNNDLKSLNRKLDKHLVFVVNQKVGDKKLYLLPHGIREDGETLRQSAERILKDSAGGELKAQIYSNAPCGFYKYRYPTNVKNEKNSVGAKVFIYFARYLKGQLPSKGLDYKWLDRQELQTILPTQYNSSISQFLIDE